MSPWALTMYMNRDFIFCTILALEFTIVIVFLTPSISVSLEHNVLSFFISFCFFFFWGAHPRYFILIEILFTCRATGICADKYIFFFFFLAFPKHLVFRHPDHNSKPVFFPQSYHSYLESHIPHVIETDGFGSEYSSCLFKKSHVLTSVEFTTEFPKKRYSFIY